MNLRKRALVFLIAIAAMPAAAASILPGFRLEKVVSAEGFVTSVAFDEEGNLFFSETEGGIYRVEEGKERLITTLPTASIGNAVLLGIALRGDEIIAHYVKPDFTADVISSVDPEDGKETVIAVFECSGGRPCSTEHHGGNPIVAPDGSIYVGIGDFGGGQLAQQSDSPGGKIWKIAPDGTASQFALGFRNPFDLTLHPSGEFLIVSDNGPEGEDEIAFVRTGDNHGWPATMGIRPAVEGMVPPHYVFPGTVAPTGVALVRGLLPGDATGLLVGGFVTKSLYFFPDIEAPAWSPILILSNAPQLGGFNPVLDVAQNAAGEIVIASAAGIWRLVSPLTGDVNGDGVLSSEDLEALAHELVDGDGDSILEIQGGSFPGSWAADVNRDGVVDTRDLVAWVLMGKGRERVVGR